jgi:hypothetical protein
MDVKEHFEGRGLAIIAASDALEYAWEDDELKQRNVRPSVFTNAIVEGLETGDADLNNDGLISADELYDYVFDRVSAETPDQTPTMSVHGIQGDLYLALNPHRLIRRGPLPDRLHQAVYSQSAWERQGAIYGLLQLLTGGQDDVTAAARDALQRLSEDVDGQVRAAAIRALSQHEQSDAPIMLSASIKDEQTSSDRARRPEKMWPGTPERIFEHAAKVSLLGKRVVSDVAFGPNGRFLASASNDKTVKVWEIASGKILHT